MQITRNTSKYVDENENEMKLKNPISQTSNIVNIQISNCVFSTTNTNDMNITNTSNKKSSSINVDCVKLENQNKDVLLNNASMQTKQTDKLKTSTSRYPPEITCPFGEHLMVNAVMLPCCGYFICCEECIRERLNPTSKLYYGVIECPNENCLQEITNDKHLTPYKQIRNMVEQYLKDVASINNSMNKIQQNSTNTNNNIKQLPISNTNSNQSPINIMQTNEKSEFNNTTNPSYRANNRNFSNNRNHNGTSSNNQRFNEQPIVPMPLLQMIPSQTPQFHNDLNMKQTGNFNNHKVSPFNSHSNDSAYDQNYQTNKKQNFLQNDIINSSYQSIEPYDNPAPIPTINTRNIYESVNYKQRNDYNQSFTNIVQPINVLTQQHSQLPNLNNTIDPVFNSFYNRHQTATPLNYYSSPYLSTSTSAPLHPHQTAQLSNMQYTQQNYANFNPFLSQYELNKTEGNAQYHSSIAYNNDINQHYTSQPYIQSTSIAQTHSIQQENPVIETKDFFNDDKQTFKRRSTISRSRSRSGTPIKRRSSSRHSRSSRSSGSSSRSSSGRRSIGSRSSRSDGSRSSSSSSSSSRSSRSRSRSRSDSKSGSNSRYSRRSIKSLKENPKRRSHSHSHSTSPRSPLKRKKGYRHESHSPSYSDKSIIHNAPNRHNIDRKYRSRSPQRSKRRSYSNSKLKLPYKKERRSHSNQKHRLDRRSNSNSRQKYEKKSRSISIQKQNKRSASRNRKFTNRRSRSKSISNRNSDYSTTRRHYSNEKNRKQVSTNITKKSDNRNRSRSCSNHKPPVRRIDNENLEQSKTKTHKSHKTSRSFETKSYSREELKTKKEGNNDSNDGKNKKISKPNNESVSKDTINDDANRKSTTTATNNPSSTIELKPNETNSNDNKELHTNDKQIHNKNDSKLNRDQIFKLDSKQITTQKKIKIPIILKSDKNKINCDTNKSCESIVADNFKKHHQELTLKSVIQKPASNTTASKNQFLNVIQCKINKSPTNTNNRIVCLLNKTNQSITKKTDTKSIQITVHQTNNETKNIELNDYETEQQQQHNKEVLKNQQTSKRIIYLNKHQMTKSKETIDPNFKLNKSSTEFDFKIDKNEQIINAQSNSSIDIKHNEKSNNSMSVENRTISNDDVIELVADYGDEF